MPNAHKIPEILIPEGTLCVPLFIPAHPDYVGLLVGQLRKLELKRHYEADEAQSWQIIQQQWRDRTITPLIEHLTNNVDCCTGHCVEFEADEPAITYYPQNPFTEPNTTPSGYLTPPFTRWADFIPLVPNWLANWLADYTESLTGYRSNDIIVDISSMPLNVDFQQLVNGIFPQISLDVSGTGTAKIKFINFPLGGRAIITVDATPNIADIFLGILGEAETTVELNRDLLSLPIESTSEIIQEVHISETGQHTIYITFVPVLDDSLIPIQFGGGLRSIELCGFGLSLMAIEDIRLINCNIEAYENGVWTSKINLDDCLVTHITPIEDDIALINGTVSSHTTSITNNTTSITNLYNNPSITNTYPPAPTQAEPSALCGASFRLANEFYNLIDATITDAQTITADEFLSAMLAIGQWQAQLLNEFWDYIASNYLIYPTLSADCQAEISTIAEYLYCNDLDLDAVKTDIANSALSAQVQASYIKAIDTMSSAKIAQFVYLGSLDSASDCSAFCGGFCYNYNFTTSQQEWTLDLSGGVDQVSKYSIGNGFYGAIVGNNDGAVISRNLPQIATINNVLIHFTSTFTGESPRVTVQLKSSGSVVATSLIDGAQQSYSLNFASVSCDEIRVIYDPKQGAQNGTWGSMYMDYIEIQGTGANPEGISNC